MTQYPNEKDPRSSWLNPPQGDAYPAPSYPPPTQGPYTPAGQGTSYAPPSQFQAPGYYPEAQAPPPDYGYAVSHPDNRSASDRKGGETWLSPPSNAPAPTPDYGYAPDDRSASAPSNNPYGAPAPTPDAGSSTSQDANKSGIMVSLAAFFGNKGPPPMWQRQPPQLPYGAFPPMCLISNGKNLTSGFPELPPPCQLNPHPFATHDVTAEDWKRFLADVKSAASLTGTQRIRSNVIPMVMGLGFIGGIFMTSGIERKMKYKNRQAAGDLVDHWNHYFFGPRRMEVVLCQASERLSGKFGAAPVGDPNQARMAHGLRKRGEDSSSDDSCSDEDRHGRAPLTDRHARRAARRDRRELRRARKAERRDRKAHGENERPYELFITAV